MRFDVAHLSRILTIPLFRAWHGAMPIGRSDNASSAALGPPPMQAGRFAPYRSVYSFLSHPLYHSQRADRLLIVGSFICWA
jgi:hypothetical protein